MAEKIPVTTVFVHDYAAKEMKVLDVKVVAPQTIIENEITYPAKLYKRGERVQHASRLEADRFCLMMKGNCEVVIEDSNNPLSIFAVYDHPKDFPDHVVVREWKGMAPTSHVWKFGDLNSARESLAARGLVCLARQSEDDPCIVETWL